MKTFYFLFIIIWTTTFGFAQCPTGIVKFQTQEDIDNFIIQYPHCTEIEGNVTIEGDEITNLNGLSNLTSIGGYLQISFNGLLENLNELNGIKSIGGDLNIYNNNQLTNLEGFNLLESIGGNLGIGFNSSLTGISMANPN